MNKNLIITGVTVLATMMAASTQANSVTFSTPSGTSGSDGALDATVSLSTFNGGVNVTITDNLANPKSAGQLVSGLVFDITDATGAGSLSGQGVLATLGTGGSYTPGSSAVSLTHWTDSLNGSTVTLTALGGSQPSQMIIGPDNLGKLDGSGKYSNANSSIDNFNPSVLGTATFVIDLNNVTINSTISDISIEFGTGPDTIVGTPPPSVPDGGSTVALLGFALCGFGLLGRKFGKN